VLFSGGEKHEKGVGLLFDKLIANKLGTSERQDNYSAIKDTLYKCDGDKDICTYRNLLGKG